MFSSLASYLFGAQPTSDTTESNKEAQDSKASNGNECNDQAAGGDVIEVTSSTPSVAGNNRGTVRASGKQRGGKNRRGKQRQQQQQQQQGGQRKPTPTITKLLTPNSEGENGDFDDDEWEVEWCIVEKEDDTDSLPRSESDEESSMYMGQPKASGAAAAASRRRQHINSHSLYSGPRPQQQRNYLQRNRAARPLSVLTVNTSRNGSGQSQSLYAPSPAVSPCGSDTSGQGGRASILMEESWYVTPPPCFTSIGPINMETSPFENLLIEHPSMSVYHSIRPNPKGSESFVNLDLEAAAQVSQQETELQPEPEPEPEQRAATPAVAQQRATSARYDRHAATQLKQQTLALHSQKSNNKKQHQQLCRSAIKRSNKVRDFQAKHNRPRRSEMQHCKLVSGANNNRKCCF